MLTGKYLSNHTPYDVGDTDEIMFSLSRGRGEGNKAADCLRVALRDYNLKFATILNDPDLASFRALPEFKELQEEVLSFFLASSSSYPKEERNLLTKTSCTGKVRRRRHWG